MGKWEEVMGDLLNDEERASFMSVCNWGEGKMHHTLSKPLDSEVDRS